MACLDTNVIIEYMKGNKEIVALVNSYASREEMSSTTVTEYELRKYYDQGRIAQILILDSIKIYHLDRPSAKKAAEVFNQLRADGKPINENDILIAAIAITNNEVLITRDKDFKRVRGGNIIVV